MKKSVITVFLILGAIVVGFIGWNVVTGDGGVVETAYTAIETSVNGAYAKVAGTGSTLLPKWDSTKGADTGNTAGGVAVQGQK